MSRDISRQLAGWAFSLQEIGIKGARHLTEQSRNLYHQRERAQAFMADLKKQLMMSSRSPSLAGGEFCEVA